VGPGYVGPDVVTSGVVAPSYDGQFAIDDPETVVVPQPRTIIKEFVESMTDPELPASDEETNVK
jgi:hypothetical protein